MAPEEPLSLDAHESALLARSIAASKTTGVLHLSHQGLIAVPRDVFDVKSIVRLDLGWNEITTLGKEVGSLVRLEQLWLNGNPLQTLPPEIEGCHRLRTLDLRDTSLVRLPHEMGRLTQVNEIALGGVATLKPKLMASYADGGTPGLMAYLKLKDETKTLKIELEGRFREGIYREVSDDPHGSEKVRQLTKLVFRRFTDNDDIKNLIRNCERLFPANIDKANVAKLYARFLELRRQNERKKLAAELELKLRVIYFDRINPASVEGIVKSVYAEIESLEDIQFLIKHAPSLFPESSEDIVASEVRENLVELQRRMAEERAAAMALVEKELRTLYSHMEPRLVLELTEAVCVFFKRVEELKKLAADASQHFPAEFEAAMSDPRGVRRAFVRAARESEAMAR